MKKEKTVGLSEMIQTLDISKNKKQRILDTLTQLEQEAVRTELRLDRSIHEKKRIDHPAVLRGFTAVAERLNPEQVVNMLNIYFEEMVDIILRYGGTINEIIGDALLVIFGAPQKTVLKTPINILYGEIENKTEAEPLAQARFTALSRNSARLISSARISPLTNITMSLSLPGNPLSRKRFLRQSPGQ